MASVSFDIHSYNWSFLDTNSSSLDNFCVKCHKILEEPMLIECCGSHICKPCAKPLLQLGKLSQCVNCDEKFVACITDKKKWKFILDLAILCPLHKIGCQWTGNIRGSQDHLILECYYASIECTAGCGEVVERHELTDHLENICLNRLATCQYCGKEGQFGTITGQHLLTCNQYYIQCPNGCGDLILRLSFSEHLSLCSEFNILCVYNFAGCKMKLKRRLMQSHMLENIQRHSYLQSKFINQTLHRNASEQNALIELSQRTQNYHKELAITEIARINVLSPKGFEEISAQRIDRTTKRISLKIQKCEYKYTKLFNKIEKTIKYMLANNPNGLWEVNSTDIQFEFKLTSGQFDELWTGYKHKNRITVKKHKMGTMVPTKFIQEAIILKRFEHDHILTLIGVCTNSEPILIVMEYATQTLLNFLTKQSDQLTTISQTAIIQQIASGMAHVESLKCIHRAVNISSVLMGDKLQCKIGNFKFAKILDNDKTEYNIPQGERIPIKWSPPEALLHSKFTTKSDVWAFGILQYEVMNRSSVKMSNTEAERFIETGGNLECPPGCPKEYYKVIEKCLSKDPDLRPTFTALLQEEHLKYNLLPIPLDEIIEPLPSSDTESISSSNLTVNSSYSEEIYSDCNQDLNEYLPPEEIHERDRSCDEELHKTTDKDNYECSIGCIEEENI